VKHSVLVTLLTLLASCAAPIPVAAQVTITYAFSNGSVADADQVNTNFSALGAQALNRTGGTITGNIAVSGGVTIDGVDVGVQACTTCTPTFSTLTLSSAGASALDVGGGINAGTGNVGIVDTTGKIPALTSTYFAALSFDAANLTGTAAAINGSNITALNATQLTSGTVPDARLSGTYSSALTLSNAANAFTGSGASLTSLNATQLTSGTLPDARLSGTYSGTLTWSGGVTQSGTWTRISSYAIDSSKATASISAANSTVAAGTGSTLVVTPSGAGNSINVITGGVDGRLLTLCFPTGTGIVLTTAFVSGGGSGGIAQTSGAYRGGDCAMLRYDGTAALWWYVGI
jgi:hypothetical protein